MSAKKKRNYFQRKDFACGLALTAIAAAMGATSAVANEWSYPLDPGRVARSPDDLAAAKASWETPEYRRSWGLTALRASTAYALGYYGQGVTVGIIDSGFQTGHQEFLGSRFVPVVTAGTYGTSGYRYRHQRPQNPFIAGRSFYLTGEYNSGDANGLNASHGTSMLGVLGANRDGGAHATNMHGFAFASNIALGNTGGSDSNSHGPFHDYTFVHAGYKALVDAGSQVINSSWGQINNTVPKTGPRAVGRDGGNLAGPWYQRTLADEEYIHFFFRKAYAPGGNQYDPAHPGASFVDAMFDAVKGTGIVHVRSAANTDQENPNNMAFYPYFVPEAEKHWVAVGGLTQSGSEYRLVTGQNEAGPYAKWWYVAAPNGDASTALDNAYGTAGGTSGSSPHVTGALAILLSRFPNLDAAQVRDVVFTTAQNKQSDGVTFLDLWTAPDGVPDERYGWGYPDIGKAVYGPGQFLGPFKYNASKAFVDVWSNNIGETAIKARQREELAWLQDYRARGIAAAGPYNLNMDGFALYGLEDIVGVPQPANSAPANWSSDPAWQAYAQAALAYQSIDAAQAERWRKEWMDKRAAFIQYKVDNGLYNATLVKSGAGTLFLTGDNTYSGGSTVAGGKLSIVGTNSSGVTVGNGGTLGGTGSVGGTIAVLSGGVLRPGVSAAEANGITTVAVTPGDVLRGSAVKVGLGASFVATLKAAGASSRLNATGAVALGGKLVLDVTIVPNRGDVYTLIQAGSLVGTFAGLPEGALLSAGGQQYRISYQGNRVTLTAS